MARAGEEDKDGRNPKAKCPSRDNPGTMGDGRWLRALLQNNGVSDHAAKRHKVVQNLANDASTGERAAAPAPGTYASLDGPTYYGSAYRQHLGAENGEAAVPLDVDLCEWLQAHIVPSQGEGEEANWLGERPCRGRENLVGRSRL
jgi:hypothetical protein